MKIKSLSISNFRQFCGEVVIKFSTSNSSSVTVIHGENGAGKTSLLNAFKWVLYGTTDFDTNNENILSEKARAEAKNGETITMSIKLEFEDEGSTYSAHREQKFVKGDGLHAESIGLSVPTLKYTDEAGLSHTSSNPSSQLNQILPEDMHGYFFFNGERIEKLAYDSASKQVREAIKSLMGLNILDRSEKQLNTVVLRHFNKEAKESSTGNLAKLYDKQVAVNDEKQNYDEEIRQSDDNKSECDIEIEEIDKRLLSIKAIARKQKLRNDLNEQVNQINEDKSRISKVLSKHISERGFLAFIDNQLTEVENLLNEMRTKGEIPSKIKSTFIDDLVEMGKCICGAPIDEGSSALHTLMSYKKSIKDSGVEQQYMVLYGSMAHFKAERAALFGNIRESMKELSVLNERRKRLLGRIDELGGEILAENDSSELEQRRNSLREKSQEFHDKSKFAMHYKEIKEKDLENIEKDIEKELKNTSQADLSQRRKELAKEVAQIIGDLHESMAHQVRKELSSKVDTTFRKIMKKDYWAEIDEDFTLKIFKSIEGHGKQPVFEKSTGENQVTSLCFISSIVNSAKERAKERAKNPEGFQKGGIYPIVMDSPFGALDPEYREKVASFIPELADQVIVMVSESQWRGEVEKELAKRLGKQYTLKYHKPQKDSDVTFEYTTLEEGFNG